MMKCINNFFLILTSRKQIVSWFILRSSDATLFWQKTNKKRSNGFYALHSLPERLEMQKTQLKKFIPRFCYTTSRISRIDLPTDGCRFVEDF